MNLALIILIIGICPHSFLSGGTVWAAEVKKEIKSLEKELHASDQDKLDHENDHDDHKSKSHIEHKDEDHEEIGHDHEKHTSSGNEHEQEDDHEHVQEEHQANSHDEHEKNDSFGKGKAIIDVSEEGNKFILSEASEKFLGINLVKIKAAADGFYIVPKESLVEYQSEKAIYVKNSDWFEAVKISRFDRLAEGLRVFTAKNLNSLEVAVSGLGNLRSAHLQASGQGGQGHAH